MVVANGDCMEGGGGEGWVSGRVVDGLYYGYDIDDR